MKQVCIICDTLIANDPRVMRQILALHETYNITVIGKGQLNLPNVTMCSWDDCYKVATSKLVWFWYFLCHALCFFTPLERRFSIAHAPHLQQQFDVVIINEVMSLPLGFLVGKGAKIYCDLHEYYFDVEPGSVRSWLAVRYYRHLCQKYLPQCQAVSTVCEGIARLYEKMTGQPVFVVFNVPKAQTIAPSPVLPDKIRLIHHGLADRRRHIEGMIEMMDEVDSRFTLDLMLTTPSPYRDFLQKEAAKRPNIVWKEPVPMPEIPRTINQYDLGLYILPPTSVNTRFALPNKLFEFMQARLGIAIGPSAEMKHFVQKHDLGVVADSFDPKRMAQCLNALQHDDIVRFKNNAHQVAMLYSSEEAMNTIRATVERLSPQTVS